MKFRYKTTPPLLALFVSLGSTAASQAQVIVTDFWVRSTVSDQQATGAFMQPTFNQDVTLVMASSTVAALIKPSK